MKLALNKLVKRYFYVPIKSGFKFLFQPEHGKGLSVLLYLTN